MPAPCLDDKLVRWAGPPCASDEEFGTASAELHTGEYGGVKFGISRTTMRLEVMGVVARKDGRVVVQHLLFIGWPGVARRLRRVRVCSDAPWVKPANETGAPARQEASLRPAVACPHRALRCRVWFPASVPVPRTQCHDCLAGNLPSDD